MAADIVLLDTGWPSRALLRAQLIEEGFDVLATDTWAKMRRYLRPGSKPQLAIVDLQGLPQPEEVLGDLQVLMPPGRVLVLSALGTIEDEELDRLGFRHVKRPIAVADVVAIVRNAMGARAASSRE
jgi:DNA-binding response OmpR family regulator